jgi:hypothetical protein
MVVESFGPTLVGQDNKGITATTVEIRSQAWVFYIINKDEE